MILGRELPSWKQIINKGAQNTDKPFMEGDGDMLLANSWMSIRLISDAVLAVKKQAASVEAGDDESESKKPTSDPDRVIFWLPDYFCNETLYCFRRDYMDIVYYPIDENMDPDWGLVRAMIKDEATPDPDIILMAHYFGVYHDIAKMRDMANNSGAILIEDCAHCLYPHPLGQIGSKGDFVIYSQHKQLPVSDGAVLRVNPDAAKKDLRDHSAAVADALRAMYEKLPQRADMNGWYMKKGVQKVTPIHRAINYKVEVHMGENLHPDEPLERISEASYHILAGYSYEDYKRIAYLRRDNLSVMNAIIRRRIPGIRVLNQPNDTEIPYMAVYSMADLSDEQKEKAREKLKTEDFTVLYWPDLPAELAPFAAVAGKGETSLTAEGEEKTYSKDDHSRAFALSRDIFVIPTIHQDVTPQKLIKKFGLWNVLDSQYSPRMDGKGMASADVGMQAGGIVWPIEAGPTSVLDAKKGELPELKREKLTLYWEGQKGSYKEAWDDLWKRVATTNIPQDYIYGDAKSATEGWGLARALIRNESGENVGLIQLLIKKVANIPVAIRINRGPVLIREYDCIENQLAVMNALRKKFFHPIPIAWAPFMVWSPEHLSAMTGEGWISTDPFAYPSGYLDLTQSEEEIEANMKSFWRKHIKQAKKLVTIKINEYDAKEVMRLYAEFLEYRQIPGIPDHILKYLFGLENPPLEVLTAHNEEGTMIAYKVLYRHGNTGTSFIAWNTDEGRDKQARTLLIYTSALHLKSLGCTYYDLGGIDDITTEAVAKYKRGTGDTDYRLQGEFIGI